MTHRVYLPLTIAELAAADESGEVVVADDAAVAPDDTEEQEYAALMTAADGSAARTDGRGRRVVLVAELARVPEAGETVPRKRWVAVHVDESERPAGADPDDDLGWYAVQEIAYLL